MCINIYIYIYIYIIDKYSLIFFFFFLEKYKRNLLPTCSDLQLKKTATLCCFTIGL